MNRLKFLVRVGPQLANALAWYESQDERLKDDFLHEMERSLDMIRENPQIFPIAHGRTRRTKLHRFPYKIFYRTEPGFVTVVALVHEKRKPRRW